MWLFDESGFHPSRQDQVGRPRGNAMKDFCPENNAYREMSVPLPGRLRQAVSFRPWSEGEDTVFPQTPKQWHSFST